MATENSSRRGSPRPSARRFGQRKSHASKKSPSTFIIADAENFRLMVHHVTGGGALFLRSNFEAVKDYVRAVRGLACELLDLMAEGLRVEDSGFFSRLIRDVHSDSVLRLNHYPPSSVHVASSSDGVERVGFGEHTDPQILTVLRSNDVGGLQLCTRDGHWVGVPPDPHGFYVMVGDLLQVMTNGRFESVKHRVVSSTGERRMSTVYFGAPPLNARISPLKQLEEATKTNTNSSECKYKTFTWSEYKKAAYALRLGDCRLNLFKRQLN